MNVLYLCADHGIPVLGHKGASVHVRALASALTEAGHEVVVVAPLLDSSPWESHARFDVRVLHVPVSDQILSAMDGVKSFHEPLGIASPLAGELRRILYNQQIEAKLLRRFRHRPPDIIYERASLFGTAGVAVARALGLPHVLEVNAPLGLEQSTYRGAELSQLAIHAERYTLGATNLVITVSSPLRDYVIDQGVATDRVVVMPNGIDPTRFRPGAAAVETRRRWNLGPGPVIGFVGGLRPWHGAMALPALLQGVLPRHPNAQLVVAGDGPLRERLARECATRGLASRVLVTGAVPHEDVPDLIRAFDVAVAPYDDVDHLFYFSPLKVFEYMGCGVAVVASALGQVAEVVRHGETGLLTPPGDVDALTNACLGLLDDVDLRCRLGTAAAHVAHSTYTWARNAARVADLARSLLAPQGVHA